MESDGVAEVRQQVLLSLAGAKGTIYIYIYRELYIYIGNYKPENFNSQNKHKQQQKQTVGYLIE